MSASGFTGFKDGQDQDLVDYWIKGIWYMTLDEITYKINGCAMKVHNTLGNGFQEVIYQRCLAIEFNKAGLKSMKYLYSF